MSRTDTNVTRITESWKAPAALDGYLKRIGAEIRNFRRYVVKREGKDHYHYDACIIKVIDGQIVCLDKEYAPTASEAEAIAKEIAYEVELKRWPRNINARNTDNLTLNIESLKAMLPGDSMLFEFKDERGEIIFVQQRIKQPDGSKNDYPWSFWSDNKWRSMEPDGNLPLYGLEKLREAAVVFIHEGAKCAAMMTDTFLKDHPWRDDLLGMGIVHLGWPGGAPNPHRVDWDPIKRLSRHVRVIIVADNDISGREAVSKISKIIQRPCSALMFGEGFPAHYDLADPWPDGKEVQFEDCIHSATWATRRVGEKTFELREEFLIDCYFTIKPQIFIHRSKPNDLLTDKEFNGAYRAFSDVKNLTDLVMSSIHARCDSLQYEPGMPTGKIVLKDYGHVYNAHRPTLIKPKKGDVKPWLEFLEHLFPAKEDQHRMQRWIATLVTKMDIKMRYGVMLISETQGVGKDTLIGGIISPLIGRHNVSSPSEDQLTKSEYNSYVHNKRLIHANEIYAGHSSKAYNVLKNVITDQDIEIHLKYHNAFKIRNWAHVIACSNSLRALKLDYHDRRWYVPVVSEDRRTVEYWNGLHKWIESKGALSAVLYWAQEFVRDPANVVGTGEYPPMTDRKQEVTRAAMALGELTVDNMGIVMLDLQAKGVSVVMRMDRLRLWLQDYKASLDPLKYKDGRMLEHAETIASILRRRVGLFFPTKRFFVDNKTVRVVANFDIENSAVWSDLQPFEKAPKDVFALTEEGKIWG